MSRLLLFTLILFISRPALALDHSAGGDKSKNQNNVASYQDIVLNKVRSRYYLSTLTLRLGLPGYGKAVFEEDMGVYPKDAALLRNALLAQLTSYNPGEAIKVSVESNALIIQVDPQLKAMRVEYDALLQTALTLIQQANGNKLPLINGRALKTALVRKDGIPVDILKHSPKR